MLRLGHCPAPTPNPDNTCNLQCVADELSAAY